LLDLRRSGLWAVLCSAIFSSVGAVDIAALKNEVERLRNEIKNEGDAKLSPITTVDDRLLEHFDSSQKATTGAGRLVVGGLVQVWYQSLQNDARGIVTPTAFNNVKFAEPNSRLDNDTFRIRRTELRFTLDIADTVTAYVMLDPSREANITFSPFPVDPSHDETLVNANLANGMGQQFGKLGAHSFGNAILPQVLQDAFLSFHDVVPHHDFQIGQFKPPSGEESWRSSGFLDFIDRSMVTSVNNVRDIGVMVHGTWFYTDPKDTSTGRIQYWFGAFNGPNDTVLTDPEIIEGGNRSDDNNYKDFCWRIAGQPVWSLEKWYGRLETGIARTDGVRGKSGSSFNPVHQINSVNSTPTAINRQAAWIWYRPNGPVVGWWLRGEWGSGRDRISASMLGFGQTDPAPVTASGWFMSSGYKLSKSIYVKRFDEMGWVGKALKNSEFTYRYEAYQNIATENLVRRNVKTDLFKTAINTAGFNYYIDGYNARLQANYAFVNEPHEPRRGLRGPRADQFVINLQLQF